MLIFVLTRLLLSREDRFFHLEPNLENHDVKPEVVVEFWIWHWIDVLKVVMNKKKPEQISSDSFLTIY